MSNPFRYPVPAETVRVHTDEKRSRFITTIARASSPQAAKAFIDGIREEFPDARHNCWSFVAAAPGDLQHCGMSDDGEPRGTAGKPMLNILSTCGVGEIAVVVTRYFGGIKLGTGGLVRAYSAGVQAALAALTTIEAVQTQAVQLSVPFELEHNLRHRLQQLNVPVIDLHYSERVTLTAPFPVDQIDDQLDQLRAHFPQTLTIEIEELDA
jgi:uncharacterized YigZ family protein